MIRGASAGIRVVSLRSRLGRLWHTWRDGRRLARARSLVPLMVRDLLPTADAPPPSRWVVRWSQWSPTGVAVMGLGPQGQAPVAVLKAAYASAGIRGLRVQAEALARLHADARLGDWRQLLPRAVVDGEVAGWFYTLQEALPGVEAQARLSDEKESGRLLWIAATAIRPLHARTTERTVVDDAFLAHAIDRPIGRIGRIGRIRRIAPSGLLVQRDQALGRLARELRRALAGRAIHTGWIHGDLWLGNVLVNAQGAQVTGIVDWSMAAPHELALHDLLHLILYTRQVTQRCELGDVVRAVLSGAPWEPHERELIEAAEPSLPLSEVGQRAMVLLYWLRRLSSVFEQERGQARNPVWVAWNVDGVLQCL